MMKMKIISALSVSILLVALCAYWMWQRPYRSQQPLLPITQQSIAEYKPIIPDKSLVVSRSDIQACVERSYSDANKDYLAKYQTLLEKGRPYYSLTVAECWELMLSFGDDAAVLSAWSDLYCVSLDAAVDAAGHMSVFSND